MTEKEDGSVIGRQRPAKGIILSSDMPLVLWCTVAADQPGVTWVAQDRVMHALVELWSQATMRWLVGDFVLMPDHLHFFCRPKQITDDLSVERWTGYWKDRLTKKLCEPFWRMEDGIFHTRIRSDAHYRNRMDYLRENPVKAGLVNKAEDWPWRGKIGELGAEFP